MELVNNAPIFARFVFKHEGTTLYMGHNPMKSGAQRQPLVARLVYFPTTDMWLSKVFQYQTSSKSLESIKCPLS